MLTNGNVGVPNLTEKAWIQNSKANCAPPAQILQPTVLPLAVAKEFKTYFLNKVRKTE